MFFAEVHKIIIFSLLIAVLLGEMCYLNKLIIFRAEKFYDDFK